MIKLTAFLLTLCLINIAAFACGEEMEEKPDLKLFRTKDECYLLVIQAEFMGGEPYGKRLILKTPEENMIISSYLQTWRSEESTDEVKLLETEFCIDNDYLDHSEIVLRYGTATSFCSVQQYLYTNFYIKTEVSNSKIVIK